MVAAVSTPAEQALVLRDLAARVENGTHKLSPESAALLARLAQEADDAEVDAIAEQVMNEHASILEALAK